MKPTILVMDEDPIYSKKFCNYAIKLLGKKYTFLTFSSIKAVSNYTKENKASSLVISDTFVENVNDINIPSLYIINEKHKNTIKEGKRTYIYRLQNSKNILEAIDTDLSKTETVSKDGEIRTSKTILFYSPVHIKNKFEIIKRFAKHVKKGKKVLVVDIDEFENYKGQVGLSNIIFNYKENALNVDKMRKEITTEKNQDFIKSITYPDDMNLINSQDLSNIVNELKALSYDYIFVNSDTSYIKCQSLMYDSDEIVAMKDKNNEKFDKFKNYIRNENQIDIKKITEFDMEKVDKVYLHNFLRHLYEG